MQFKNAIAAVHVMAGVYGMNTFYVCYLEHIHVRTRPLRPRPTVSRTCPSASPAESCGYVGRALKCGIRQKERNTN